MSAAYQRISTIIYFFALHDSMKDFRDNSPGVCSIALELRIDDGADVPADVGNRSMCAPRQGSR